MKTVRYEGNQRYKCMERYPVFMDLKTIFKISILPNNLQIKCNLLYQDSNSTYYRNKQNNPKIYIEPQKIPNSQNTPGVGGRTQWEASHFLITSYKAVVIKIAWYWHKSRHLDQENRIKGSEIDPHTYSQLIAHKGGRTLNGKRIVFSINGTGEIEYSHVKERNLVPILHHSQKLTGNGLKI